MRTRWIAAALTAAAALGGTRGDACGDKFLRVGRGARYQRGYVAIHPACILILADPQSGVGQALTELEPALKKAGHKPLLVRSQEAMDPALKTGHYNIVLADLNEVSAVMARVASAHAIGSKITHVGIPDTNLNQLSVGQLALGSALLQRVPNPYFGIIPRSSSLGDPTISLAQLLKPYPKYTTVSLYRNNVGTTSYHGFEARLEQRLSRGLSYLVSYTRSKLVDDASSVFDASILTGPIASYPAADSFDRKLERDYSTGDIPHVLVSSVVWDLPLGAGRAHHRAGILGAIVNDWTIAGIVTLQSGVPIAVTQATNFNAFAGFGIQRPNLNGDPNLPPDRRTVSQWINASAFTVAPQFTIGTSSRNPVRGPSYRNVDLALIRRLSVASGKAFEVRAEAFNLTNTPPLGSPNAVVGAPGFGTITSAGDPRVVQLALKFLF